MKVYDISERLKETVPEKWKDVTWQTITPALMREMVEDIDSRRHAINLGMPLTPETVRSFFAMFKCDRCGACCRGEYDHKKREGIAVSQEELWALAHSLGMLPKAFRQKFCNKYYRNGMKITALRYPCPFWQSEGGCTVYALRPIVCRFYPLESPIAITGTGTVIDGVSTICISASCGPAKELAVKLLAARAKAQQSPLLAKALEDLRPQMEEFWRDAKVQQSTAFRKGG